MSPATPQLLDSFAWLRSQSVDEARERIGQLFSPHRLSVPSGRQGLAVRHNHVRFARSSLHVLSYGAEVQIDPGERGDFHLLQLPLRGHAWMECGNQQVRLSTEVMGVLKPRAPTRMHWSADCAMLLLQLPRDALPERLVRPATGAASGPAGLSLSRQEPAVAAWWQTVLDLTHNLHHHGDQWMRQPATWQAMEGFLLGSLQLLRAEGPGLRAAAHARHPCLDKALDYIHAHAREGLHLADIARACGVSPRTLELAFRRSCGTSPLHYARNVQLELVHDCLRSGRARREGLRITDVAVQHGFSHLGRFAAYYKQRFGCTPTETLSSA